MKSDDASSVDSDRADVSRSYELETVPGGTSNFIDTKCTFGKTTSS